MSKSMKKCVAVEIVRIDERLKALDRIRSIDAAAVADATEILRTELARRLELLNGEQDRIAAVLAKSVTREMFDLQVGEIAKRLDRVERVSWLPILVIGGAGTALGALAVKIILGG